MLVCMVMISGRDEFANELSMIVIEGGLIVLVILNRLMYGLFSSTKNIIFHRLVLSDAKLPSTRMELSVTIRFINISHLAYYLPNVSINILHGLRSFY